MSDLYCAHSLIATTDSNSEIDAHNHLIVDNIIGRPTPTL